MEADYYHRFYLKGVKMNIEFICVCYNFQRRMMWFLSSLLQQTGKFNITVNLAYIRNNGLPSTESLISFYTKCGIKFRAIGFDNLRDIAYRGVLRNAQISLSKAEWLFFYDIDQIMPPDYFENLSKILTDEPCLFCETGKLYTDPMATQEAIDKLCKRRWLRNAYSYAELLPKSDKDYSLVVSGGLMIAKRELIHNTTKGLYSDSLNPKDRHMMKHRTYSDPVFREKFMVKQINAGPIIHLGHGGWKEYQTTGDIQQ
jgi:hypothetical protein